MWEATCDLPLADWDLGRELAAAPANIDPPTGSAAELQAADWSAFLDTFWPE